MLLLRPSQPHHRRFRAKPAEAGRSQTAERKLSDLDPTFRRQNPGYQAGPSGKTQLQARQGRGVPIHPNSSDTLSSGPLRRRNEPTRHDQGRRREEARLQGKSSCCQRISPSPTVPLQDIRKPSGQTGGNPLAAGSLLPGGSPSPDPRPHSLSGINRRRPAHTRTETSGQPDRRRSTHSGFTLPGQSPPPRSRPHSLTQTGIHPVKRSLPDLPFAKANQASRTRRGEVRFQGKSYCCHRLSPITNGSAQSIRKPARTQTADLRFPGRNARSELNQDPARTLKRRKGTHSDYARLERVQVRS